MGFLHHLVGILLKHQHHLRRMQKMQKTQIPILQTVIRTLVPLMNQSPNRLQHRKCTSTCELMPKQKHLSALSPEPIIVWMLPSMLSSKQCNGEYRVRLIISHRICSKIRFPPNLFPPSINETKRDI